MQTTRILIPETVEYSLSQAVSETMFKRAITNLKSGVVNGMRFTDFQANDIMVDLALQSLFNTRSSAAPVIFKGQRGTLNLSIAYEKHEPPKDGLSHIYTITPV